MGSDTPPLPFGVISGTGGNVIKGAPAPTTDGADTYTGTTTIMPAASPERQQSTATSTTFTVPSAARSPSTIHHQ